MLRVLRSSVVIYLIYSVAVILYDIRHTILSLIISGCENIDHPTTIHQFITAHTDIPELTEQNVKDVY